MLSDIEGGSFGKISSELLYQVHRGRAPIIWAAELFNWRSNIKALLKPLIQIHFGPLRKSKKMTLAQALLNSHHKRGSSSPDLRAYQRVQNSKLARIYVQYIKQEQTLVFSYGIWNDDLNFTQPDESTEFSRDHGVLDSIEHFCRLLAQKYPYTYDSNGWQGW